MNPLDLSPTEFQDFLTEERQYRSPDQIDDLIRRYNAANSLSGRLAGLLEPQEGRRRTSILPASVPVGMSLMEALQSGEAEFAIPQGVVDMLTGTVRGVENPTLAAQGRIPASDMNATGFETAAAAMGLAGLLGKAPVNAVGANMLRSGKMTDPTETGWTFRDVKAPNLSKEDNRRVYEALSVPRGYEVELPIRRLFATQDKVNPDFATTTSSEGRIPTVIRKDGEFFIRDGHHRLTKQAEAGNQNAKVWLYDLDNQNRDTPLLDYEPTKKLSQQQMEEVESFLSELGLLDETFYSNASKSGGLLSSAAQASTDGFEGYLSRVNPSGTRIAAEDRPNLMMGDMYGMLPRGSDIISEKGDVTFYRSPDGDYYATAYNPDVGEQDVVGYIMGRGDSTELQVVSEMQGQGIGGELQYLFRSENPDAPTGGLTEAGERALERTYDRLFDAGLVSANASKTSGFMGQLLNADDIPAKTESQKVAKRILQLRSQGRANEVTEEMMEDADPRTMAAYTPLDMSTKARMERAGLLGFKPEEVSIHGAMDNPERFTFDSDITPVYTSDNPAIANTYTAGEDSAMFDLLVKQGPSDNISDQINNIRQKALDVDVQGASYAAISPDFKDKASGNTLQDFFDVYLYPESRGESVQHMIDGETVVGPVTSTDQIAYAMRDEGVPHARIENVLDRGPYSPRAHPIGGFGRSRSFEEYKETDAANRAWERTMQDASRKPSTDQITFDEGGRLRSRFARFDPEFSHLKNLSAANASPLVGLLTQGLSEKQANKIEDYLYRTGLLQ